MFAPVVTSRECKPAPNTVFGRFRHVGPGLIITAIVVGSGELIVTPKLGAEAGFTLLWFIVIGCLVKVFVQIEFGRYAITRGESTLAALNGLPGPRIIVSWVLWIWLLMYLSLIFQVAGMVGGAASILALAGVALPVSLLAVIIGASCAVLLVIGRYRFIERTCIVLVGTFVLMTFAAIVAMQQSPFALTGAQLAEGLAFHLPERLATAFAAFGIIGVGASELIYYPYWCLEKGYAVYAGPNDGSAEWEARARGWLRVMRTDAWTSFAVYTGITLAFYLLGAAVLHAQNRTVEDEGMIETLSLIYKSTFGDGSFHLFLLGSFAVLYSTIFGATASNGRLLVDGLRVFRIRSFASGRDRDRAVKFACLVLALAFTSVFLLSGAPVTLVLVGAAAQALMLPFLAGTALYYHYAEPWRKLRAGPVSVTAGWIAAGLMVALGIYQLYQVVT